uniref:ARAD1A19382p n=1 Tax=Blastobotrys adeninivorans TaxID=409370 RepID=A0A060T3W2_BLAAD
MDRREDGREDRRNELVHGKVKDIYITDWSYSPHFWTNVAPKDPKGPNGCEGTGGTQQSSSGKQGRQRGLLSLRDVCAKTIALDADRLSRETLEACTWQGVWKHVWKWVCEYENDSHTVFSAFAARFGGDGDFVCHPDHYITGDNARQTSLRNRVCRKGHRVELVPEQAITPTLAGSINETCRGFECITLVDLSGVCGLESIEWPSVYSSLMELPNLRGLDVSKRRRHQGGNVPLSTVRAWAIAMEYRWTKLAMLCMSGHNVDEDTVDRLLKTRASLEYVEVDGYGHQQQQEEEQDRAAKLGWVRHDRLVRHALSRKLIYLDRRAKTDPQAVRHRVRDETGHRAIVLELIGAPDWAHTRKISPRGQGYLRTVRDHGQTQSDRSMVKRPMRPLAAARGGRQGAKLDRNGNLI